MLPVEHVHLKDVLQTVCVLESVILRSFGPEGGQVLFTRDTGQAMLSRSGTHILTALQLENPVARFVVECVRKHSTATGDGSKTFILLLASFLRMINATANKEPRMSQSYNSTQASESASARCLADKLLTFASKELDDIIITEVVPYGCLISWEDFTAETQSSNQTNNLYVRRLLASFFHTRLSHVHCDFISDLMFELLNHWKSEKCLPSFSFQYLNDNFPALHTPVSGFPVSASRLIEGQVIHRDFATPVPRNYQQPIKAVVFTGCLQPKILNEGEALEVGAGGAVEGNNIMHFSAWMERSLGCVIAHLQTLGVSLLLCAAKQSAATLALATQAQMCIVECVSEDELSVFAQLSGVTPVPDCWVIGPQHVATLSFCRPLQLGANRYVHVAFHDSEETVKVKPCSLVLCAPGEGQTDQYASAFRDAIRMLLTTWEPLPLTVETTSRRNTTSLIGTTERRDRQTDGTAYRFSNPLSHHKQVFQAGRVIPAGGTFEFVLHRALVLHHSHNCSVSLSEKTSVAVCQLLAKALLSVPRQIYSHSRRSFLEAQTRVVDFLSNHSRLLDVMPKHEPTGSVHGEESKLSSRCYGMGDVILDLGLESISCKYQLLLSVLQCLTHLLRVDAILHTHSTPRSQSHTFTNTSWEDAEEEHEV